VTKCWKCGAPATHIPKLVVRAFSGASPAEMFVDLPTCLKHPPKPSELLSDSAWDRIVIDMVAQRKLAPKRDLTVVVLISRKGEDVRAFYRGIQAGRGMQISTEPVH
jgi:hypothetical protein